MKSYREKRRDRERSYIASIPRVCNTQSQETKVSSRSLSWVQGFKHLSHLLQLFQMQGARLEVKHLEIKPVPMWDAGSTDRGLTYYTTAPTPLSFWVGW